MKVQSEILQTFTLFTGRSAGAGLDLTLSLKTQMSHLETSNADSAQSKDVWNENLAFLMISADCLLSSDCLLSADYLLSHLETSNADSAQSKYVKNENLEFLMSLAVCLLLAVCFFTIGQILFGAAGHLENFPSCYYVNTWADIQ